MANRNKVHVRKDEMVVVIAGKDKGKQGKVKRVLPKTNRVVVEGVNIVKKHVKPSAKNPQGGIIEMEAPIHGLSLALPAGRLKAPLESGHEAYQRLMNWCLAPISRGGAFLRRRPG